MQRNYRFDPYFGGFPGCITISPTGPFVDNTQKFSVKAGVLPIPVTATLLSSPGYTVKNVINVKPDMLKLINLNVTSVFTTCKDCKVMLHSYIDNGKGCSLWKPESALDKESTCCEFVYDLVCGTSPKYQLYDKC
ncbi:uncharacterized protein LOC144165098 [Haemaphysalis longicornis]